MTHLYFVCVSSQVWLSKPSYTWDKRVRCRELIETKFEFFSVTRDPDLFVVYPFASLGDYATSERTEKQTKKETANAPFCQSATKMTTSFQL